MYLIRWGSGGVCFELRTPDSEIAEAARGILGRWRPGDGSRLEGSWEIHRRGAKFEFIPSPHPPHEGELPDIKSVPQAVTVVEYAALWNIVENCSDILCFHSALLERDGRRVAIVGPSEAGKSTLSTSLWQSGWTFLGDDMTMVRGLTAVTGPRRVSLRNESRALVGDELWKSVESHVGYQRTLTGCLFHPTSETPEQSAGELAALVFLKRSGAAADAAGPTRLVPAEAAISLLPYTNLVKKLSFPAALAPVATLMSVVPAWDLPRAPLPDMIASVEEMVGLVPV